MEWLKDIPTTPPDEVLSYLLEKKFLCGDVIVYKADWEYEPLTETNVRVAKCRCTACEQTFTQPYIKGEFGCHGQHVAPGFFNELTTEIVNSGSVTVCPFCGTEVIAYHSSTIGHKHVIDYEHPVTVHAIDGRLVVLQWYLEKRIDHDGKCEIIKEPFEGYVVDGGKMIKLMGYSRFLSAVTFFGHWEPRKRCVDTLARIRKESIVPWDPALLNDTNAADSKLDVYLQSSEAVFPVTYLRLWQKHRNVENLVMQGAGYLVTQMLEKASTYGGSYGRGQHGNVNVEGVNWKENRPAQMLGLNKDEFKTAITAHWSLERLEFWKYAKSQNTDISISELKDCECFGYDGVKRIIDLGYPAAKSVRYLFKQRLKYPISAPQTLFDYWDMAKTVGDDLSDPRIMFPQNLPSAHDGVMRRYKLREDEIMNANFEKRLEFLSFFSWSDGQFTIFPARSAKDLVFEGQRLSHCVARYAKDHANGKTAIFFIRRADTPNTPYFTLELDEKTLMVRQNRGKFNCARTEEIIEFEEKWLAHIREITAEQRKAG